MLGLDLGQFLCLPFKVIQEPLKFLKDEKCIEVRRRRPHRRGQLPLQPDRPGPQPRRGRDEAVRLRRPGPGAAGGLRRAVLPPGRHRHRRATPEALQAAVRPPGLKEELFNAIGPAIVSGRVGVHLRPARQRQDGHGPGHRRLHEHRRRRRSTSPTPSWPRATSSPSSTRRCTTRRRRRRPSRATTTTRPSAGCSTPAPSTSAGCASAGRSSSPAAN